MFERFSPGNKQTRYYENKINISLDLDYRPSKRMRIFNKQPYMGSSGEVSLLLCFHQFSSCRLLFSTARLKIGPMQAPTIATHEMPDVHASGEYWGNSTS